MQVSRRWLGPLVLTLCCWGRGCLAATAPTRTALWRNEYLPCCTAALLLWHSVHVVWEQCGTSTFVQGSNHSSSSLHTLARKHVWPTRCVAVALQVRRVAAVEGMEMVSSAPGEPPFFIPMGHCWVLADNSNLRPEDGEVIDSRSYGHIPFTNVIGRVIYAAASRTDHGPVRNNPESDEWDGAVVEAEVDVEAMFREGGDSDGEGGEEEVEQDDWTDEHGEGAQGGQQAKGGDAKGQEKKAGNSHKKP